LSDKFPSTAAALDHVRIEVSNAIPQIHSGAKQWFHQFNLSEVLGIKYFSARNPKELGGPAGRGLKLKSVVKDKDGWQIEVVNENSDTRVVTIDESLSTVHAKPDQPRS
jgi:hypothetical protein